jgi:REP element-mobilizing transposase RayT
MEELAREASKVRARAVEGGLPNPDADAIEQERYWFREYERLLHETSTGPFWLGDDSLAAIVAESLHYHDQKRYRLDAFCIMPNHLHVVLMPLPIEPPPPEVALGADNEGNIGYLVRDEAGQRIFVKLEYFSLAEIMHKIKRRTARECNKLLKRTGEFWEHESYDHYIRDHEEWLRTIDYVLNNPVKAGFVNNWPEWRWNYKREF